VNEWRGDISTFTEERKEISGEYPIDSLAGCAKKDYPKREEQRAVTYPSARAALFFL